MPAVYSFSFLFSFCLFVFLLGPCVTTSQTPPLLFLIFFFLKQLLSFSSPREKGLFCLLILSLGYWEEKNYSVSAEQAGFTFALNFTFFI